MEEEMRTSALTGVWKELIGMTREEAYAGCPSDSYVEFYGGQWLVVPLAPVEQPAFFTCLPRSRRGTNHQIRRLT
jgi:hypothetical protein